MRYRAAGPAALLVESLDAPGGEGFTAVFHRASGMTHLLATPAPEILAALGPDGLSLDALMARLAGDFELVDATRAALTARLDELVAAGLVEAG